MMGQPEPKAGAAVAPLGGDSFFESRRCGAICLWLGLVLLALSGCETTALGVTEVVGPRDTTDTRGPYAVTVYTRGPVAKARIEAHYGPDDDRREAMKDLGDGRFLGRLPGAPVGSAITYAVILTSYAEESLTAEGEPFRILAGVVPTCLVDGDCQDAGLICDRLRGRCAQAPATCRDDGDCGQDYFCPEPGAACRFRPLTCTPEGACPLGYLCTDGRCTTAPPCTGDAQCAAGQTCLNPPGRCVGAPECTADVDCPAERPRCDVGRCIEAEAECGPQRACDPGLACEAGRCVPEVVCNPRQPCPDGQLCDAQSGRCVPDEVACRRDEDCVDRNQRCEAGRCVDGSVPCRGDDECAAGEACVDGLCGPAQTCAQGAPCPRGLVCDPLSEACVGCFAHEHCPVGLCDFTRLTCVEAVSPTLCAPCGGELRCEGTIGNAPLVCAEQIGLPVCLPGCDRNAQCPSGFFCDGLYCQGEQFCQGNECIFDEDCGTDACVQGLCLARPRCRGDGDCAQGAACRDGQCEPRAPACIDDQRCPPGTGCFLGHCVPSEATNGCQACETAQDCDTPAYCIDVFGDGQARCLSACGTDGCRPNATCQTIGLGISLCVPDRCEPQEACGRDDFEPNDSFAAASQVNAGVVGIEGVACARDVDVFRVAGLTGFIEVAAGRGALRVEIWGRDQQLIDVLDLGPFDVGATEIGPRTGFLFIHGEGGDTAYQIGGELRAGACMDDVLEENDDPRTATPIGNGADVRGRLCGADFDYFRLRVPNRGRVSLELSPGDNTFVSARLLTDAGEVVERIEASGAVELDLDRYPDNARIFSVQCAMCGEAGGSYRLRMR